MAGLLKPLGLLLAGLLLAGPVAAARIAIVIDDLGNRPRLDRQTLALPRPVAVAVLPLSPGAPGLARQAAEQGREVLIHLPMQSVDGRQASERMLHVDMQRPALQALLQEALARLPQATGLNNHQGSLATRHPVLMAWLMQALQRHGLWYLDSRTSAHSLALQMAQAHHVPATWRDVFLDDQPGEAEVRRQFRRLLALARSRGEALAIGHPRPATLAVLHELLSELPADIRLVPPSELLQQRRAPSWQQSLSPSQKAARNWKRSPSSTCCAEPKSK